MACRRTPSIHTCFGFACSAAAAPYEAPLSLVIATPTDTATATGHITWTTTCLRGLTCTSTVSALSVRLDAPLDVDVGSVRHTLHEGEFGLLDEVVGTRWLTGSTVTVDPGRARLHFEGHATTGTLTVPVDGQYTNPNPLQITLPSRGAPSFTGTFLVAGVPVTVTTR